MSLLHSILLGLIQGWRSFCPFPAPAIWPLRSNLLGMAGASDIPELF